MSRNKEANKETIQEAPKKIFIYADIDIDKLYNEIVFKSKKIRAFLDQNHLESEFVDKMKKYKNLRICLDNEAQKFVNKKELNKDLKNIKKHVFSQLEDFMLKRFKMYLDEQTLHDAYTSKVSEIQLIFEKRMNSLMKEYEI